ncbi:unnamed protein product [Chrysoparadoxa australica]
MGEKMLRSSVQASAGGVPKWEETLVLTHTSMPEMYRDKLIVEIIQRQTGEGPSDVVLGSVAVPVNRLPIGTDTEVWFDLAPPAGLRVAAGAAPAQLFLAFSVSAPLRGEVKMLLDAFQVCADTADASLGRVFDAGDSVGTAVKTAASSKLAIPAAVGALAAMPIVLAVAVLGAPIILPVVLIAGIPILVVSAIALVIAICSRPGRGALAPIISPIVAKLQGTSPGQRLLYETGPRPSPYAIMEALAPSEMWGRLVASALIDMIGCSSYLVPLLGEVGDVAWAPLSAMMINTMYADSSPYAAYIGLLEELLPFTDIIPTASLAWVKRYAPEIYMSLRPGSSSSASQGQPGE